MIPFILHLPVERLTPREIEILTLTAYGKTRSEIARILSIKATTVKEHMERTFLKLNVSNNTHASTVALALGLIAPYRLPPERACSFCEMQGVLPMEDAQSGKFSVTERAQQAGGIRKER
jgi:DNA-binding CsgD family transcriptional regulator